MTCMFTRHLDGKDRERLGVLGLGSAHLNEPPPQTSPRAFVREEQADSPRADDQDIGMHASSSHVCSIATTEEALQRQRRYSRLAEGKKWLD
jgi:hypothetical protein